MDRTHFDKLRRLAESLAWQLAGRPDADPISAFGIPDLTKDTEMIVLRAFARCGDDHYWAHEDRVPKAHFDGLSVIESHERQEQLQEVALARLIDKLLAEVARRQS